MFAHCLLTLLPQYFTPETTAYSDVTSANKVTSSIRSVLNSIFKAKSCWLASENLPRGHRFFLLHPLRYYTVRSEVDWREDSCSVANG